MSLLGLLLNPIRSLLGSSIRAAFEPEVRHNPTIVNADTQSDDRTRRKEEQYGFAAQYVVPLRRPRTDTEAQRLYNHIRTVSWYLDAIPLLGRRLPFNIGVDSIIGILPGGDFVGLFLSLYAVMLCAFFGLPFNVLGLMMINVVVDACIGLLPILGDALDVYFKANLRNLRLLEDHLIATKGSCTAGNFNLVFPPSDAFLPKESPQRQQQEMPHVSTTPLTDWLGGQGQQHQSRQSRGGWASTGADSAPRPSPRFMGQDFHKGTMKKVKSEDALQQTEPTPSSTSTTIVPNEVFTTMRYSEGGISLQDLCGVLPQMSCNAVEANWKEKEQIPLLERHISRLVQGVEAMKEAFPRQWGQCGAVDRKALRCQIEKEVDGVASCDKRVRVSINQVGRVQVTSFAMKSGARTSGPRLTVRTDVQPIDIHEDGLLYKYKTGHRDMYDAARERVHATLGVTTGDQAAPADGTPPCFDVLMVCALQDGRGVIITESSIANVLLHDHRSGNIYTPLAIARPLLPGLLRAELLARRVIQERDLLLDEVKRDLAYGEATLYLCNALRGLIPVTLID